MDCLFCAIGNGDIPSNKVYEDENVLAFLDINPTSYGHTLVIPKKHAASFVEADPEMITAVFTSANKVAKRLQEALKCDGINVLSNVGEAAGQSVPHFHVHLIPRYNDKAKEALTLEFGPMGDLNLEEIKEKLAF